MSAMTCQMIRRRTPARRRLASWPLGMASLVILALLVPLGAFAEESPFEVPIPTSTRSGAFAYEIPDRTVIGLEQTYTVRGEETLIELARLFGLGYNELVAANPEIDPWNPPVGTILTVPTVWVLPEARDEGVVINISEMRLYYFFKVQGLRMVKTFPIGIGREGATTPLGVYRITDKVRDPIWFPPDSARLEDPALPAKVPPGPENPLGGYWLQLTLPGYGIHGTNKPWGIGRMVSRGCIRLYPEDIPWLFDAVERGTRVQIVNQPVKFGVRDGRLYVQVRSNGQQSPELLRDAISQVKKIPPSFRLDRPALRRAILEGRGLALPVSG